MTLDRKVVRVMSKIQKLDLTKLSYQQLVGYFHCMNRAEEQCKWFNTSITAKNLARKIQRELGKRVKQRAEAA